jgi:pimeloyl-ACP methyl ester carboxylesterase
MRAQEVRSSAMTGTRKWLWLPPLVIAGFLAGAQKLLLRAFAPPQRPADKSPADLGLPEEQVWLESITGKRLHGWYIPAVKPGPAVIVLHGWGGNAALMLPLAPHLHEAGFHALFLDARNHGFSEHDRFMSMPRFAEDLEAATDWLNAHEDVSSVGVIGHSVGAGAAILSASRNDRLAAVVSVASFAHPGELMRDWMSRLPKPLIEAILFYTQRLIGFRFDDIAPRNTIKSVKAPLMLVHGDCDQVVPISSLRELAAARDDTETLIVEDGAHSDLEPYVPYVPTITAFLDLHLAKAAREDESRSSSG